MPYFHNERIHVLYIHIPKTGGTSIEEYFSKKYAIPLSIQSLYTLDPSFSPITLQHQTLTTLRSHASRFNILFDTSLMVIASVRNPYTRLLSHLSYMDKIHSSMTPLQVETIARNYLKQYDLDPHTCDNHLLPQHMFVTDDVRHILKQESLSADMAALGFTDFQEYPVITRKEHLQSKPRDRKPIRIPRREVRPTRPAKPSNHIPNYSAYMTSGFVKLVNTYYKEDFVRFGYEMIA